MINTLKNSAPIKLGLSLLVVLFLGSCGNTKKTTEPSVFNQRKAFKQTFHEANSEKMIGHYEKAIALFETCLLMEAENHAVFFALSDLYEKMGDKEKTLTHAQRAYELNSANKWYALRLADLYFAREEFSKTADLYSKIIADEKNIDLKFKYTDALIKSKRYEKAIEMMDEISVETGKVPEVSFTKHDLLIELGRADEAEKELESLIAENPTNSDYKIMVAEFYMQQGNFDKSKTLVTSILKRDSTYGQAYIMLADIELRQDNVAGAFENLEKGFRSKDVELDRKLEIVRGLIPYTAKNQRDHEEMKAGVDTLFTIIYDEGLAESKLHEYYGFFWVTQENYKKAATAYKMATELDPSAFNTWLQLLDTQREMGDYEAMFMDGKKAAELFPAQPIIYLLTGIGAKESEDFEAAEEWFFLGKDLVVKDPQLRSEFFYQLGDMNFKQGNADEGKFYFDQAIQTFPGNINVYADNALRLKETNELNKAETEIKKGLEIAPKSAKLLDIYGQILFEKKEYQSATDVFVKALYDDYQNGEILEHYADALYFTGKKEEAIELWQEAIKYGNASPVLKQKLEDKTYYEPE